MLWVNDYFLLSTFMYSSENTVFSLHRIDRKWMCALERQISSPNVKWQRKICTQVSVTAKLLLTMNIGFVLLMLSYLIKTHCLKFISISPHFHPNNFFAVYSSSPSSFFFFSVPLNLVLWWGSNVPYKFPSLPREIRFSLSSYLELVFMEDNWKEATSAGWSSGGEKWLPKKDPKEPMR